MKKVLIALALAASTLAVAAPPTAPSDAKPSHADRAGRAERAEQVKAELGLTDQQAAAMRNEMERHRAALRAERAEHRGKLAAILTPEQLKKLESSRRERVDERLEARCEGLEE